MSDIESRGTMAGKKTDQVSQTSCSRHPGREGIAALDHDQKITILRDIIEGKLTVGQRGRKKTISRIYTRNTGSDVKQQDDNFQISTFRLSD